MNRTANLILAVPLAMFLGACVTVADDRAPTQEQESDPPAQIYSEAELDQMLAPIALYPDALLSQILMAATYPLEIVQAARWSRANPGLEGEAAVKAAAGETWDPSVKSLVAFPQILQTMDEKLEWTQSLGDAFLAQQTAVMDAVQRLRQRAYDAGNLQSNAHQRVEREGGDIIIRPATVEVVHVPYYDPRVVYGPWWWAGYPPVYWSPWPGYVTYSSTGFYWSVGVFVGPRFFFGFWDWPRRHVVVVHKHVHVVPKFAKHRIKVWRHDPKHRRGVKYRHPQIAKKFFAPPHVRLRDDAKRDGRTWHARPHEQHTVRHRGDVVRPGIGRLGPRHDRLTLRRGLIEQPKVLSSPELRRRGHPSEGHRGGRDFDRHGAPPHAQPRFRVNAPQVRAMPQLRSHSSVRSTPGLRQHRAGGSVRLAPRVGSGTSGRILRAPGSFSFSR